MAPCRSRHLFDRLIEDEIMTANPYDESVRALDHAHEMARAYGQALPNRRVGQLVNPENLASLFNQRLPEQSADPVATLDDWFRRAEPGIVASPGPRFFGFVIGGATPAAL